MLTVEPQNIVKLQLTEYRVYALSASGKVYVLAADALNQEVLSGVHRSTGSWSSWLWRENKTMQYQEIAPKQALGWSERYMSFSSIFIEAYLS